MSRLDTVLAAFETAVAHPWAGGLAGAQKVWMVVYDEADERRLLARLGEFALAAGRGGHAFVPCDVSEAFGAWIRSASYRESYFRHPDDLLTPGRDTPLDAFRQAVVAQVREALAAAGADAVVALVGCGALFGLLRVSDLVEAVHSDVAGRLAVFFPGTRRGTTYRLLDARDGWDYHAVPIPA